MGEYPSYIACNIFNDKTGIYVEKDYPRVVQEYGTSGHEDSYITDITDTTVVGFKYFDFKDVTGIRIKTRGYGAGTFEVLTALDGEVLGKVDIEFQNIWTAAEGEFRPADGASALYLRYRGNGNTQLSSIELLH